MGTAGSYRVPFIHGGFPVAAFFLLSGFLTGRRYIQVFATFSPKTYGRFLLGRLRNGYGLYVLCLVPNLCRAWPGAVESGALRSLLEKLFYNLTLTQTLFPNGTAMSISSVSWFFSCLVLIYCAFPVLARLCLWLRSKGTWAVCAGLVGCLLGAHWLEPVGALYASPIFRVFQLLAGMLLTQLPAPELQKKGLRELAHWGAGLLGVAAYFCILQEAVTLLDTLSCAVLIYLLAHWRTTVLSRILGAKPLAFLGQLSLPIFLIHGPVLFIWGRKLYSTLTCAHKGIVTGLLCLGLTLTLSAVYLLAASLLKRGKHHALKKAGAEGCASDAGVDAR